MKKSVNIWRVGVFALVAASIALAIAYHNGALPWLRRTRSANSIIVLVPYRYGGTWVFDDPDVGLTREPFVVGVPEMIDEMVRDIPDAENGFRLLFSAEPFPGCTHTFTWVRAEGSGNWYRCEELDMEGWLCPGLLAYYREPPQRLYARAEAK
jgi:hypothetical protein